ncbi:hypothetical protein D917_00910 [Trichinella nativa]|uniref:Uncharacterized protein n=1 Tax=Trichinella nativa TaxID=6335 RepID=A0A1Y3E335_9BILA|nr:hypothetical protein D917_00910 [Trichinella nativa]
MGHYARILTDDELAKLSSDKSAFNDFQKRKLESELQKNWDKFYLRNKTLFFKDRHWTREEFSKILPEACEKVLYCRLRCVYLISLILGEKVLKAGAVVFVRDYGLFDHAQLRFGRGKKMEENLYVRQDGTFAYFFSEGQCASMTLH